MPDWDCEPIPHLLTNQITFGPPSLLWGIHSESSKSSRRLAERICSPPAPSLGEEGALMSRQTEYILTQPLFLYSFPQRHAILCHAHFFLSRPASCKNKWVTFKKNRTILRTLGTEIEKDEGDRQTINRQRNLGACRPL